MRVMFFHGRQLAIDMIHRRIWTLFSCIYSIYIASSVPGSVLGSKAALLIMRAGSYVWRSSTWNVAVWQRRSIKFLNWLYIKMEMFRCISYIKCITTINFIFLHSPEWNIKCLWLIIYLLHSAINRIDMAFSIMKL